MFRSPTRRVGIHPLEKLLLTVVALHLIFLPWALGTQHFWSQLVSLVLSSLSFIIALLPRNYSSDLANNSPGFRLLPWPKLIRFPIFWLGLLFLGYVLIQALNPAFRYTFTPDQKGWFMAPIAHISWLPTGMDTPFAKANAWRSLIIYGSVWLSVCAVWVGLSRRKSLQTLLTVIAVNGVALAILGFAQRGLSLDKIFGFWTPPASYFVASFPYKNHAGAYFNLMLSVCAGLAYWHYSRGQRRLEKSTPGGLFMFFAAIVTMIVLFSYSRTATFLMMGFQVVAFGIFIMRELVLAPADFRRPFATMVLATGIGASVALVGYALKNDNVYARMQNVFVQGLEQTAQSRNLARDATWDMVKDNPITGWGAGSFRFYFPKYQLHYPEITTAPGVKRLYWEHAHNDYLEFLAEVGIIGVGLLLACLSFGIGKLIQVRFWANPASLLIVLGLLQTLVHCWADFNFQNPAILITWCILWPVLIRWTELEEARSPI
jgi:O-antigen ligase